MLACDFYNGGAVACMSDEDIIKLLVEELLPAAVPEFEGAKAGLGVRGLSSLQSG